MTANLICQATGKLRNSLPALILPYWN